MLAVGVGACVSRAADEPADPVVVPPVSETAPAGPGATTPDGSPALPDGFGTVRVAVTSPGAAEADYCLLLADTPERRQRGLMEVTDTELAGFDGMLFRFEEPAPVAFWMRNTRIPLSIAYFGDDGRVVSITDMEPCPDGSDCPTYPAGGAVRWAIEVPQGQLPALGIDAAAVLTDTAETCSPSS